MKKIAFMFVAAAMFAACGGNKETKVEEAQPVPVDTAAVTAQFDNFVYELTAEDSAALAVEGVDTLAAEAVAALVEAKKAEAIAAALQAEFEKLNPAPAEEAPAQ